jgi:AcrR family transcriptional regulator
MGSQLETPWNRPTESRPAGLSRGAIVAAAIEIADEEGLEAVSIRRIATKLETRPMSLYTHIETKEELVDLMIDEVIGETVLPGELPEDWREALRRIAQATRAAARAHPWTIGSALRRRLLGPNALRHIDQSLGAIAALDLPFERKRAVQLSIDTYTLGYVRWEVLAPNAGGGACAGEQLPSQDQVDAYLREQVEGGEYPHLAAFAARELTLGVKPESFEAGLEWLLAGIAAEVESRT